MRIKYHTSIQNIFFLKKVIIVVIAGCFWVVINIFNIVMCIWWHNIRNKNNSKQINQRHQPDRYNIRNINNNNRSNHNSHVKNHTRCTKVLASTHNIKNASNSSWIRSVCSIIIAIHCLNVIVVAIASDSFNLNTSQQQQQQQLPCDRTRRVFTEPQGEISDGPAGYNYTQVSICLSLSLWIIFL